MSRALLIVLVITSVGCQCTRSFVETDTEEVHHSCNDQVQHAPAPQAAPVQQQVFAQPLAQPQFAQPQFAQPQFVMAQQPQVRTETCAALGVKYLRLPIPFPKIYPVERTVVQQAPVQVVQQAAFAPQMMAPPMMPSMPMCPSAPTNMCGSGIDSALLEALLKQKCDQTQPPTQSENTAALEKRANELEGRLDSLIEVLEKQ